MIRSGWGSALPRRLVLVTAAVLLPVLAGCEAGNNAPTLLFHYPTETAGTTIGHISLRNVFVLGAPLGGMLHKGQSAGLFLAAVNDGAPDKLVSISAPGSAATVTVPSGGVPLIFGHPVYTLAGPAPKLELVGLTKNITNGSAIRLVLTFQKAGQLSLLVPVMARVAPYLTYSPPPPSPSPSARIAAKHHKSRASATPSPSSSSGTPTPTPSPTT